MLGRLGVLSLELRASTSRGQAPTEPIGVNRVARQGPAAPTTVTVPLNPVPPDHAALWLRPFRFCYNFGRPTQLPIVLVFGLHPRPGGKSS